MNTSKIVIKERFSSNTEDSLKANVKKNVVQLFVREYRKSINSRT